MKGINTLFHFILLALLITLEVRAESTGETQSGAAVSSDDVSGAGQRDGSEEPATIRGNYILRLSSPSLLDEIREDLFEFPAGTPPFFIEKSLGSMGIGMDLVSVWSLEEIVVDPEDELQSTNEEPSFCSQIIESGIALTCSRSFQLKTQNFTPSDPLYPSQFSIRNRDGIKARGAWNTTQGSFNNVVVVADTGIDFTHPDLAPNMWVNPLEVPGNGIDDDWDGFVDNIHGVNFVSSSPLPKGYPMDDHGHGTHIAGIIGARGNDGIGITGVNWNVRLLSLKIADQYGTFSVADVIHGLNYIYSLKVFRGLNVRLINISWGQYQYDQMLYETMAFGDWIGIVFVVAAGNSGSNNDVVPFYPANYNLPNMIVVGSTKLNKTLSSFSNFGMGTVDITAPGEDILSTGIGGSWYYSSGTSQATAMVTGAAALLISKNPLLNNPGIISGIKNTSDYQQKLNGFIGTSGFVNAQRVVEEN